MKKKKKSKGDRSKFGTLPLAHIKGLWRREPRRGEYKVTGRCSSLPKIEKSGPS